MGTPTTAYHADAWRPWIEDAFMTCEECWFETDRLSVAEWHRNESTMSSGQPLAQVVTAMMSAAVTQTLPGEWQGPYTQSRAESWIEARDQDGPTLLAVEKASGEAVGLMIVHESGSPDGGIDIRLGYLLAESTWGRGLGSELVAGFVVWCRGRSELRSLAGGVAPGNMASVRILERTGFRRINEGPEAAGDEWIYELVLRPETDRR